MLQGRRQGVPVYAVIDASVVAGDQDFQRAQCRANIMGRALSSSNTTAVEAIVIADTLQPGLDPQIHETRYINLPFRWEEYQAALDAVDVAIATAAGAVTASEQIRRSLRPVNPATYNAISLFTYLHRHLANYLPISAIGLQRPANTTPAG